jgi:hypothetical protein
MTNQEIEKIIKEETEKIDHNGWEGVILENSPEEISHSFDALYEKLPSNIVEEMKKVAEKFPGSMFPGGMTAPKNFPLEEKEKKMEKYFTNQIHFYINNIKAGFELMNSFFGGNEEINYNEKLEKSVKESVRHEFRHMKQYNWLMEHGVDLIKVRELEAQSLYSTGPLEADAFFVGKGGEQDLDEYMTECYGQFIYC